MRVRSLLVAAGLVLDAGAAGAQDASLRVGGVRAHYADSLAGTAGALSLRLSHEGARLRGGFELTHSRFTEGGGASTQAGGSLAFIHTLTPVSGIGLKFDASSSVLSGGVHTGTAGIEAFGAVLGRGWMVSASLGGGGVRDIYGSSRPLAGTSVRVRRDVGPVTAELGAATTWSGTTSFSDFTAGAEWRPGPVRFAVVAGTRTGDYTGSALYQAHGEVRILPGVVLEAAAGSYPRDLSGFTSGTFVNVGLRLGLGAISRRPAPARRPVEVNISGPRQARVTVVVPGAARVAIAGEWNEWRELPMTRLGGDRWEVVLPLGSGAYRFTLVLDGARHVVPSGVPKLPDGFGGEVGVLVVGN